MFRSFYRLFIICLPLLFIVSLLGNEGKSISLVNPMKSICIRVLLKDDTIDAVRDWFKTLMERREETLESLKNEGVVVESVFLDRQPNGDFLIYYLRAKDIEEAMAVFQNSSLAIDAYHKDCWGKYCGESIPLEQLLDLDTIKRG